MGIDQAILAEQDQKKFQEKMKETEYLNSRANLSKTDLERLKYFYSELKRTGILQSAEKVIFLRSLHHGKIYAEIRPRTYEGAFSQHAKEAIIDNPTRILAYCDGYLFSISPHPSPSETLIYYGGMGLFFRGKANYLPFTGLERLEKMPIGYLKKYRNLRKIDGVSEEELDKIGKPSENPLGKQIIKYRKLYSKLMIIGFLPSAVILIVGWALTDYIDNMTIILIPIIIGMIIMASAIIPHLKAERLAKRPDSIQQTAISISSIFDPEYLK
ncbi:hypothetical protein [Deinococcus marmoris]|uniref:hypothetical protein n=1 Tax=Deinococcus marmoris TaxID=249408 RepID=UPI0011153030|nr:hypothetical protein [Deinococcus marmoris]